MNNRLKSAKLNAGRQHELHRYFDYHDVTTDPAQRKLRPKSAHHRKDRRIEFTSGSWGEDSSDDGIEIIEHLSYELTDPVSNIPNTEEVLELTMQSPCSNGAAPLSYNRYQHDEVVNRIERPRNNPSRQFLSESHTDIKGGSSGEEQDVTTRAHERSLNRYRAFSVGDITPVNTIGGWGDLHNRCGEARKRVLTRYTNQKRTLHADLKIDDGPSGVRRIQERRPVIPRKLRPLFQVC